MSALKAPQQPPEAHELSVAFAAGLEAVRAAERHIVGRGAAFTERFSKREFDFVTDLDLEVERVMCHSLEGADRLGAEIVGEEFGGSALLMSGRYWVIDPIDGTTNLVRSIPTFTITLALVVDGRPVVGIVSAPMLGERYTAVAGQGAYVERGEKRTRLNVSRIDSLAGSLVSVNDMYSLSAADRPLAGSVTGAIAARALQIRCHGSIALDMAWVAAGRLEACLTFSNRPWDVLAGALLVTEAGGSVYDTGGREHTLSSSSAIGSTPLVKDELVRLIAPGDTTPAGVSSGSRREGAAPTAGSGGFGGRRSASRLASKSARLRRV